MFYYQGRKESEKGTLFSHPFLPAHSRLTLKDKIRERREIDPPFFPPKNPYFCLLTQNRDSNISTRVYTNENKLAFRRKTIFLYIEEVHLPTSSSSQ
ncbi:hypothetical protein TNCV_4072921 [Trichonephila clavipes]|uniref:Uncharacterized protein n=1 Tax=Trichonephila clavipes TaxID=2585209 RepID=A0A8X6W881_TRICX|nr:hypothetical protein TNCV_4072921 [Trichonephila clavipes]